MNTEKLETIARKSAGKLIDLILGNEDEIIASLNQTIDLLNEKDELNGTESTIKFNLTHKIALNLSDASQSDSLNWSVLHKVEAVSRMQDPNQPELL